MARTRIFSIDPEGAREVVEDLLDALDVCGFAGPKNNYEDEDGDSPIRGWLLTVEHKDPHKVMAEWEAIMRGLQETLVGWFKKDSRDRDLNKALNCLRMALAEMQECQTLEDLDA